MNYMKIIALAIATVVCVASVLTGCDAAQDYVPDVALTTEPVQQSESGKIVVSVDNATDDILSKFERYTKAAAPDVDYYDTSVDVIFTTTVAARGFRIMSLFYPDYFRNKEILSQYELLPEEPIVFSMVFHGDLPTTGISYIDENGEMRYFYVAMSGEDGSLILLETNPFEYPNTPSQKLFDFADMFIPYTTRIPANEFSRENPPKPFKEYELGTPLTYDELLHFAEMTDSSDVRFYIDKEWAQEIHESGDAYGLLQDAVWADINGDGTDEVVIIFGRGMGGGSEGGSVLVYTEENGAYCGVIRFYIGMQNECVLAKYDGNFYFVLMYPIVVSTDAGTSSVEEYTLSTGFGIQYFGENWAPEFLQVENGEAIVTELAWFWDMYYNNKY